MQKCSLLIATYNWPGALELCLQSVRQQKVLPDEVIIADDGSKDETKQLIQKFQRDFPVPIRHIWQPDEGFQLSRIRNKGIAAAAYEYIIQVDGDLILHPYFIHDHLELSKKGYFTSGSRVLLNRDSTYFLITNKTIDVKAYTKNSRNFFNGLRSKFLRHALSPFYKTRGKNKYYVKGCNMAFWREDLIRVNGYNEAFTGWGKEDSEIAIRLINAGIKKQFIKMGGISYHLFHKEASRELEQRNVELMNNTIANKVTRAEKGVDQYL
ncbi:MAG: glycosyltransferase family 2 protein [Filimonas sp.]|nr:glycosyltransferase family 2 protein [Filimonas sp.]